MSLRFVEKTKNRKDEFFKQYHWLGHLIGAVEGMCLLRLFDKTTYRKASFPVH
jgi:hypothetical protein